jgi:hypothetical protein
LRLTVAFSHIALCARLGNATPVDELKCNSKNVAKRLVVALSHFLVVRRKCAQRSLCCLVFNLLWSALSFAAAENGSAAKSDNGHAEQEVTASAKISAEKAGSYINWIV